MQSKIDRIKELISILNEASRVYYQGRDEIMSNYEYDALYDELQQLENETGIVNSNSPTVKVGYQVQSNLEKERHEKPMLSLDKTKDVQALREFIGDNTAILSWKLDGLTIVLTYNKGELLKAVTRGNGEVGEVITQNAKVFKNVPIKIPYKGELIIRGEAIITYSDFEKINDEIEEDSEKYKNPRNLCSGTVRQLNNEITAKRNVNFFAFSLVDAKGEDFKNSRLYQFEWLEKQGFSVVGHKKVDKNNLEDAVKEFEKAIETNDFPSDGLVLTFDDIAYSKSLGTTSKFPKDSIAFKWKDEIRETVLKEIEWSASRTGLLNPVAIFEPVELEGTTVSRASVHNISIMKSLDLGIGDTIEVYKANMIIPQIANNLTKSGVKDIPTACPVCGESTKIRQVNEVEALYCTNPKCPAKKIKLFELMVSRDAFNIAGLSVATLEKFIDLGILHDITDLFHLEKHKELIVNEEGFGEKSYNNLIEEINKARNISLPKLIYSLGIPNVGLSNAKLICKYFGNDVDRIRNLTFDELNEIKGIGEIIAKSFVEYYNDEYNVQIFDKLLNEISIESDSSSAENIYENMVFVITGSVEKFSNRNELKAYIEDRGGKVTGSVTSNTTYLINNDVTSNSSKNKKAKELGVKIISEEEFLNIK